MDDLRIVSLEKRCGRKPLWPIISAVSTFTWRDWGKQQKPKSRQPVSRI